VNVVVTAEKEGYETTSESLELDVERATDWLPCLVGATLIVLVMAVIYARARRVVLHMRR